MNITGSMGSACSGSDGAFENPSGAFRGVDYGKGGLNGGGYYAGVTHYLNFDAASSWSGYTSWDSTGASSHAQGGGQAHNNMQPYRTAICWHRTA